MKKLGNRRSCVLWLDFGEVLTPIRWFCIAIITNHIHWDWFGLCFVFFFWMQSFCLQLTCCVHKFVWQCKSAHFNICSTAMSTMSLTRQCWGVFVKFTIAHCMIHLQRCEWVNCYKFQINVLCASILISLWRQRRDENVNKFDKVKNSLEL